MADKQIEEIAGRVLAMQLDHPTLIAVDGFCAAGKTTFADRLAEALRASGREVVVVCTDDFMNPPDVRYSLGIDSPEGFYRHAIDAEALQRELLSPLSASGDRRYRASTFDVVRSVPQRSAQKTAAPDSLVIVDGLFLLVPALRSFWDYSVYVDTPVETCIARARRRNQENLADAEAVERRYRARYVPGYRLYIDEVDPASLADARISGARPPD